VDIVVKYCRKPVATFVSMSNPETTFSVISDGSGRFSGSASQQALRRSPKKENSGERRGSGRAPE